VKFNKYTINCSYLNTFLERTEINGQAIPEGWESRLDIDVNDVVIQGKSNTRVSRKQVRIMHINNNKKYQNRCELGK
jgi:hypothetical protein